MTTFAELPYTRVTVEEYAATAADCCERLRAAADAGAALAVYRDFHKASDKMNSMFALCYCRNKMDTNDTFYKAENEYYDETLPLFEEHGKKFQRALYESPLRTGMAATLGELPFTRIGMELRTFSPEIVPDLQEENRLTTAYTELLASAQIPFDGQTLTLSQLAPYKQSTERAVRKAACEAEAGFYMAHGERLDTLYDELVKVRHRMALKLGCKDFTELGYLRMGRVGYGPDDIAALRERVAAQVVPLVGAMSEKQRERLGLDVLRLYDTALHYPDGNPKPTGTPEQMFAAGQKMYAELSPETGEFMAYMLGRELFDVLSRPGKAPGGFCFTLWAEVAPFVFANFNGTAGDVDVLTHEAGHAFAAWTMRAAEWDAHREPSTECCEIHSMSMEFFTHPWMELFFGAAADRYRAYHVADALTFLPYGCMVDEFQHAVYADPDMTPAARHEVWRKLELKYRPHLSINDIEWYAEGRAWQRQLHIYELPFYYIDYVLAQITALSFWALSRRDFADAWRRYTALVGLGGRETFTGLVAGAGLPSPFGPEALTAVCREAAGS